MTVRSALAETTSLTDHFLERRVTNKRIYPKVYIAIGYCPERMDYDGPYHVGLCYIKERRSRIVPLLAIYI